MQTWLQTSAECRSVRCPGARRRPATFKSEWARCTSCRLPTRGDKHRPTPEGQLSSKPKSELTSYIIADRNHEPWNEYALDTQPVVLLKTRTILSKVESLVGCYNQLGDPLILAQHSTVHTVSSQPAPEFGMR